MKNTFLIIGLGFLLSCNRQIDCPDFNNSIMDWMPYKYNDTITLINTANDAILILIINDLRIEHTTHYMTNLDCGTCDDHIMINSNETNTDFQINIALNENRIITQHYIIKGITFTDDKPNYTELVNYSFGGHIFDSVRIFENQTSDGFQKLIIAKGFGIIGLIEPVSDTWISVGISSERLIQTVNIENISCS
jgi:hypothetical protein